MEQYPAYRESEIDWIGKFPKHWGFKRLKYLTRNIIDRSESEDFKVALENIESNSGKYIAPENSKEPSGELNRFEIGDILFNKLRPYLAKVYLPDKKGASVGELLVLRPSPEMLPRFAFYRLISADFIEIVNSSTYGAKMPRANWDSFISHLRIPYPPLPEQEAIASFLDRKTKLIDDLIAKKEHFIELKKEEHAAIINQAVTKGLDPDVPMKDSGIEWLGEIPEHWDIIPLKHIIKELYSGVSVNSEDAPAIDDEVGILKTSCVYNNFFNPKKNKKVLPEEIERVGCPVLKGRIVISRMNTPNLVGASGYVEKDYPNLYLPDRLWITEFHSKVDLDAKWLSYILISNSFRGLISSKATGTSPSMKNISKDDLLTIRIPFPNRIEQEGIRSGIEISLNASQKIIDHTLKSIDLLKEYKTTLISEAVTGKIKITRI